MTDAHADAAIHTGSHPAEHDDFHVMSPEEARSHRNKYLAVFVALGCLTAVTVGVAQIDLSTGAAITVALIVASIKASLVAAVFMHLMNERALIKWVLILTAIFFIGLMALPGLTTTTNYAVPSETGSAAPPPPSGDAHH